MQWNLVVGTHLNHLLIGWLINGGVCLISAAEEEDDVKLKQAYMSHYENMQITAIFQPCLAQKLTDSQQFSPQSSGKCFAMFNASDS